jgi:hypothetical protein
METAQMSWTERRKCSFEVMPDGEGRPDRIYVTLGGDESSLLKLKQIGRLFFGLRKGTEWAEAEEFAKQMDRMLGPFCINHPAYGEDGI